MTINSHFDIFFILCMSILQRTGTSRNNVKWVAYATAITTKGQYLKRTGTSRNNVQWLNVQSSGTHNVLNRVANGRNDIAWGNATFNFFTPYTSTYKSSTTITIPSGCGHIDIFCVGGGGGGCYSNASSEYEQHSGGGGGGGYTKTVSNLAVSAGQSISIIVGSGGAGGYYTYAGQGRYTATRAKDGSVSSASRSGTTLCTANGGCYSESSYFPGGALCATHGGAGGSAGGCNHIYNGASDGGDTYTYRTYEWGHGQGTTTRAFGSSSGTLYAGGGGAGGWSNYDADGGPGTGGAGGGGAGNGGSAYDDMIHNGGNGTANTGGGGGGGETEAEDDGRYHHRASGGSGGSGVVLIRFNK